MRMPEIEIVLAAVGIAATFAVWSFDRFMPGRKRIGYRVQMDTAIGMNPQDAHTLVQLRLIREGQEVSNATLALLRVENDGSKDIVRQDYQEPLSVEFSDRTIVGADVPDANPPNLAAMLTRNGGLRHDGGRLVLPRVPLNRKDHFKLLVLLTGEPRGEVTVDGFLSGGRIRRNQQRRGPRKIYLGLGAFLVTLLGVLGGLWLNGGTAPAKSRCASGELTVDGSTAFQPLMEEIAEAYEAECPGAAIEVRAGGSLSGIRELRSAGQAAPDGGDVPRITVSDGPAPSRYRELRGRPLGVVIFSVVVNKEAGVHNLTRAELRDLYSGRITNWRQLGGNDVPVSLVSRSADSGTRQAFEDSVLGGSEPAVSSDDCTSRDRDRKARVIRCERGGTAQLLAEVGTVEGAIGYTEMSAATRHPGVERVQLDGYEPDIEPVKRDRYPYWTVEYAYTYGSPQDDGLTAEFLAYLNSDTAKNLMRSHGHVPCVDHRSLPDSLCRP